MSIFLRLTQNLFYSFRYQQYAFNWSAMKREIKTQIRTETNLPSKVGTLRQLSQTVEKQNGSAPAANERAALRFDISSSAVAINQRVST